MFNIQAAVTRLQATEVSAAYTGTKVKDLAAYVKSLCPSVKFLASGPGGPGAGFMSSGLIHSQEALALVNKLIKDGWSGSQRSKTVGLPGKEKRKIEYMIYFQEDPVKGMPYVKVSKPDSAGNCRIIIEQVTSAALKSRRDRRLFR